MINLKRIPNPDDNCYKATRDPVARVWRLQSPHSRLRRYFRNVRECEEFARKDAPAATMLVCDAEGCVERRVRWGEASFV